MQKTFCKDFVMKSVGEYHDLYLKSNTLLLSDVFRKLQKNVFKNLSFRSCNFPFSSWISMASSSEKTEVKVEFLSDTDLLLIVENVLERMKIEKFQNLVANFHDEAEYVICVRNLKQALNHVLGFKKICRMIKYNKDGWLKPYIDMNTKARQKAKNNIEE